MNRMKSILLHIIFVKYKLADLNLDNDFVPFFSFFPKWKGRKYFFCNGRNPVFTAHRRNLPTLPRRIANFSIIVFPG